MTRLLIFDWDGTLRDSIAAIVGCAGAALAEIELEASPAAIRETVGLSLDEAIPRWCPEAGPAECRRIREGYGRHWIERWHRHGSLFPGVEPMLTELEARGFLLAVATGKSRVGLERDLERHPVRHLFHASRTADESSAKPSPAMVLELMEELGAHASSTVVIGDTSHDLLMAHNAGVGAVAVTCGAHGREELETHDPLVCLDRTTDLLAWLDGATL